MPLLASGPSRWTVLITDRDLNVVGDPVYGWTSIDVTVRFNAPASGTISGPRTAFTAAQLAPGNRVLLIRSGQIITAGRIENPGPESWSVDGPDTGPGSQDVTFADDLASVVARVTYPDPTAVATAQTTVDRWTYTGNAEDCMRALVNLNAGPGALSARRVPHLVLGADMGVGSSVTYGTRFDPLGDALRFVALAGGGLGFRTQQVTGTIEFQVYQPPDLRSSVRFSRGLGNLRSYRYEPAAPTATVAIVGGKDEGSSRVMSERINTAGVAAWGRLETFVDQRQSDDTTSDTTELDQAGDEALTRGAESAALSTVTVGTVDLIGQLGALVTVELNSGAEIADVVREVHVQVTPAGGEQVTALIGSSDASSDPAWVRLTRDLERRMRRLEAI